MPMTAAERNTLAKQIAEVLAFSDPDNPITIEELRTKMSYNGQRGSFTRFLKNRFIVAGDKVYLPGGSNLPPTEEQNDLCKKLAKVVDRLMIHVEALEKENARLRNMKAVPTLSERAIRALATYGD